MFTLLGQALKSSNGKKNRGFLWSPNSPLSAANRCVAMATLLQAFRFQNTTSKVPFTCRLAMHEGISLIYNLAAFCKYSPWFHLQTIQQRYPWSMYCGVTGLRLGVNQWQSTLQASHYAKEPGSTAGGAIELFLYSHLTDKTLHLTDNDIAVCAPFNITGIYLNKAITWQVLSEIVLYWRDNINTGTDIFTHWHWTTSSPMILVTASVCLWTVSLWISSLTINHI